MRVFIVILCAVYAVACGMERCQYDFIAILSIALKTAVFTAMSCIVSYNYEHRA